MPIPLRVLILEDQPTDAELILHELRRAEFDPEWQQVESEEEYLAALQPTLDIIISDYSLPQFDGLSAVRLLRARGLDLPFILVSGTIGEDIAVSAMKEGADDYLLKDRLARLGPAVKSALEQTRLRDERKQAEQALRNSEARYRALFEQSPNGVLLIDLETGKTIEANETAHKQLGYTREEFAALRISDYEVLEKPEETASHMRKVIREGNDDFETLHRTKSGEIRNMHVWAKTVQLSDRALFYAIFQDITERKQAEEAIRRNEALLIQTGKMAKVGGWELDLPRMKLLWSPETYRIHETDPSFQPDLENAINFYAPEARPIINEAVRRASEEGTPYDLELPFITAKGRHIWVRAIGQPEFRDGKCVRLFGAFQDITDRKLADEQILKQLTTISALYATTQKLTHKMDFDFLVKDVTRICVESFEARAAWIGRIQENGSFTVLATHGQGAEALAQFNLWQDAMASYDNMIARSLQDGFPVVVGDLLADPRAADCRPIAESQGFVCGAAFPLIIREQPFGVLSLWSNQKNFFDEDRVGFLTSYSHQVSAALENARLFTETEERLKNVQALRAIDRAITSSLDLTLTFGVVLQQTMSQLKVDAASILLLTPGFQTLEYAAGRGFRTKIIERTRLHLGEGRAGRVALDRQTLVEPDLPATITDPNLAPLEVEEKFVMYACAPLIAKGKIKGVLEVFNRSPLRANDEWREFLETLAGQTAIAIESYMLLTDLQRSNAELNMAYDTTLEGWSRAMDLRDKETEGHTQRVTEMTVKLAHEAGMTDEQIANTRRGALLHDMGKLGIPDSILLKPEPLADDEWVIMKKHPQYAYDMLSPIPHLRSALDIPLCHHEKWDGTGYPRGLKGEAIPLAARLFAVADVWDAVTSDRPYRPAWSRDKARAYILEQSGKHFDPQAVEVFLRIMALDSE